MKNPPAFRGTLPPNIANAVNGNNAVRPDRTIRKLSDVFKSLADENRLRILFMLSENGEMNVSAIGKQLGQSQPAVSHHLTQLKSAGLVEYRRDGKFNFYALNPHGLHELLDNLFPVGGSNALTLGNVEIGFKKK